MWSCNEALAFGRQAVRLTVLRLGWNPRATTPSLLDRLFSRSERSARSPLPARPAPDPGATTDAAALAAVSGGAQPIGRSDATADVLTAACRLFPFLYCSSYSLK